MNYVEEADPLDEVVTKEGRLGAACVLCVCVCVVMSSRCLCVDVTVYVDASALFYIVGT